MKNILVTQRQDYLQTRDEYRDSVDIKWYDILMELEMMPILVPNMFKDYEMLSDWVTRLKPDGLVLTGGNDLGEFASRDLTETFLLNYASKNALPVLGVCRGLQLMAHLGKAELIKSPGHAGTSHELYIGSSKIRMVKSYHDFVLKTIPEEYLCIATAQDGSIEHISHKSLPWQGVMWHPEREVPFSEHDKKIFMNIFYSKG